MEQSKRTESLKFLCSYGGKILPRHSDGKLRYVGGLTRVLSVDPSISYAGSLGSCFFFFFFFFNFVFTCWVSVWIFLFFFVKFLFVYDFAELMVKLGEFCGFSVDLRCQLPDGDLETLISIKSDEELANLVEEYRRFSKSSSSPPPKIRAVLSPPKSLKKVSPSPSEADLSSPTSVFAAVDSSPNRYVTRSCSPLLGVAAGRHRSPQRSFERVCYYPCHVQRSPCGISYNHYRHHHHQHHPCQPVPSGFGYSQWH